MSELSWLAYRAGFPDNHNEDCMELEFALTILLTLLISGGTVAFLLPSIVRIAVKKDLYDIPDDRHIHVGKVPRLGGVAFLPAMILSLFLVFTFNTSLSYGVRDDAFFLPMRQLLVAGMGAVIMWLTGVADDLAGVRYRHKFIAQIAAAVLMCASGVWIGNLHGFLGLHQIPVWLGVPLTVLIVMLIVNSINLIDGIDGLASGLCLIGICAFATVFVSHGFHRFALVAFAAIGCLVPFYFFNVFGRVEKKNKIFLGDTGSLFMGYFLAFFAVKTTMIAPLYPQSGQQFYLVFAYSVLMLPVFDVMRVFMKRIRRTRNPFLPDKTHIHHKFLAIGLSMRQSRWVIFLISALFFALNLALNHWGLNINLIVLIDVIIWCGYHMLLTKMIIKRYERPGIVTINTDLITW